MRFYRNFIEISFLFLLTTSLWAQQNNQIRLAQALERDGSYEMALDVYQDLFKKGEHGFTIILGLQNCYSALNLYPELVHFMQEVNRLEPNNLNNEVNLGKAYFLNQQPEKAMEQWQLTIQKRPREVGAYRTTARVMTELRLLDEAIAVYESALKNIKNQENLYRDMAYIRRSQLDFEHATEYLLKYYLKNKAQKNYVRSQFIAMAKDDEAAKRIARVIEKFLKMYPADPSIQEYQATLHIRLKEYAQALDIYKKIKNLQLLNSFADEAQKGRAWNFAIDAYKQALLFKQDARSKNRIRLKMAQTYMAWSKANKVSEHATAFIQSAREILTPLTTQTTDPASRWRALERMGDIELLLSTGPTNALKYYKRAISESKVNRLNDHIRFKVAEIYLQQNQLVQARKTLKKINGKQRLQSQYQLGLIDYYQGQFSAALKQFNLTQKGLATSDTLLNNVLERTTEIEEFRTDSLSLSQFARAELWERQNNLALAATLYRVVVKNSSGLKAKAALKAASVYLRLADPGSATTLLSSVLQNEPNLPEADKIYFLLAQIMAAQDQPQLALNYYLKLVRSFPQSFLIESSRENARKLQKEIEH